MRLRLILEAAILVTLAVAFSLAVKMKLLQPDEFLEALIFTSVGLALSHLLTPELNAWLFGASQFLLRRFPRTRAEFRNPASHEVPEDVREGLDSFGLLPPIGAELWVVASGKGGVGKSLLALGLAESLSRRKPTLLLDFDLHNRGLTSLLGGSSEAQGSAFSLLDEFRKMIAGAPESLAAVYAGLLQATSKLPADFTREHFNTLVEKFAREVRSSPEAWENLHRYSFLRPSLDNLTKASGDIPIEGDVALYPQNAFFLPSRRRGEPLLLSEVSASSYVIVFLFLRALSWWLRQKVDIIVLDCHGAHDMFTVGSILAAEKLVVVTTTDPGSFDGTAELLNFVKTRQHQQASEIDTVVVFNTCRSWDENLDDAEKAYGSGSEKDLRPVGFVCIAENDEIREIMSNYAFGRISKHKQLWASIREITRYLGKPEPKSNSLKAQRPSPSGAGLQGPIFPNQDESVEAPHAKELSTPETPLQSSGEGQAAPF